jgi:LuxR family maltose regulon positive regulatory protein
VPVKTSAPRFSAVYPRSRLFDRLDIARRQHAVTLVNGPPGAGKTALVSSYLTFRHLRCLWYQVDSGDDDVATFFHYFSQAAQRHLPPDEASLRDFDPHIASGLTSFTRRYFREFYAAQKTPLVVVLDNYQELADESPSHELVRVACEETPENCHVVIASREGCPTSLARMRVNRTLSIINADDLVLTLEETHGIAESQGMKPPSMDAALALQSRSAGWTMGLILLLEHVSRNNHGAEVHPSLPDGHEPPAFDYFAGEVFRKLDAGSRDLLLQSALLPKMTMHLVARLTGTAEAGTLLLDLMRRNHFVTRHGSEEHAYQFHPLFREFLLEQGIVRFSPADLDSLRRKAAEILISDRDHEGAVVLLEQTRDWQRMVEVILTVATPLRAQGRVATLAIWISKLPPDLIEANPWLLYWHAISKAFSHPSERQVLLQNAYEQFRTTADLPGMALSWSELMDTILGIHTDLRQMDPWLAEFSERLEGRLELLPSELHARLTLAFFVVLSFRQPLHPQLPVWLERVRRLLESEAGATERPRLRQHLVTHHILRGEHAEAESVLSMLHYADDLPAAERPPRTPVDYISEATVALNVGMGERCLRAVAEGLRAAEGSGNPFLDSVLLQLGAAMSLNRGEVARADAFLAAFERLAEKLPLLDRGAYYAVAAWRKFQAGEPTLALQLLRRAVAASEARGTAYYIASDNLGLGLLLHLCGNTDEALRHLELGRSVGTGIKNPLIEYVYHLFSACIASDLGEAAGARAHLATGMRLGRQQGYMHFLFFPPQVIARLCLMALEAEIETDYVRALIERNALMPDPAWRQSESWPWPIRVYTFGRFGVIRHGVALRFTGKAQKKPLELLKALIAFGGRDVSEAKLADALWPGAEGDSAAQALATTLFRLRKLIGEQVIRRQENRLTLDPAFCWVDCWAFERLLNDESVDAPTRLEKLRKLHQGPFLDAEDDAPWTQPMRERLDAKLHRLLRALGGAVLLGDNVIPWWFLELVPY